MGKTCKTCAHLRYYQQSRKWYKCTLRTDLTHGAKTDQRVKWEACARYTPRVGAVTGAYVERMEEI